jgi:hypothetical protein
VLRFEVSAETLAAFREAMRRINAQSGEKLDDDSALLLMARAALGASTGGEDADPSGAPTNRWPCSSASIASAPFNPPVPIGSR